MSGGPIERPRGDQEARALTLYHQLLAEGSYQTACDSCGMTQWLSEELAVPILAAALQEQRGQQEQALRWIADAGYDCTARELRNIAGAALAGSPAPAAPLAPRKDGPTFMTLEEFEATPVAADRPATTPGQRPCDIDPPSIADQQIHEQWSRGVTGADAHYHHGPWCVTGRADAGVSDEELARVMWEARSNIALRPGPPLPSSDWERIWRERLTPDERDAWIAVAQALRAALAGGQG